MPVYMIQAGTGGPVKIGISVDPIGRAAALQGGHYEDLRVVRIINGGVHEERWLHHRYAALHVRNEWFRWIPEMADIHPAPHASVPKFKSGKRGKAASYSKNPLGRWLRDNDMTVVDFGKLVGRDHSMVSRYVTGRRTPSLAMVRAIEAATNGGVSASDWISPTPRQGAAP